MLYSARFGSRLKEILPHIKMLTTNGVSRRKSIFRSWMLLKRRGPTIKKRTATLLRTNMNTAASSRRHGHSA